MDGDIKLNGDTVVIEGRVIQAEATDLILDNKDRRNKNSTKPLRRALVHDFNDGLTINFEADYPGGATLVCRVNIPNSALTVPHAKVSMISPSKAQRTSSAAPRAYGFTTSRRAARATTRQVRLSRTGRTIRSSLTRGEATRAASTSTARSSSMKSYRLVNQVQGWGPPTSNFLTRSSSWLANSPRSGQSRQARSEGRKAGEEVSPASCAVRRGSLAYRKKAFRGVAVLRLPRTADQSKRQAHMIRHELFVLGCHRSLEGQRWITVRSRLNACAGVGASRNT